jgi:hypothetical protein
VVARDTHFTLLLDRLERTMTDTAMCRGKIPFPFLGVRSLTMIAVGVGIAPMIQVLRGIFKSRDHYQSSTRQNGRLHSVDCEGSGSDGGAACSTAAQKAGVVEVEADAASTAAQKEGVVEVEVDAASTAAGADKQIGEPSLPASGGVPAQLTVRCSVEKIVLLYGVVSRQ